MVKKRTICCIHTIQQKSASSFPYKNEHPNFCWDVFLFTEQLRQYCALYEDKSDDAKRETFSCDN